MNHVLQKSRENQKTREMGSKSDVFFTSEGLFESNSRVLKVSLETSLQVHSTQTEILNLFPKIFIGLVIA